ncbi:Uncharacterised protein [Chlamydia abortus]|uniref:hypothetical protein n=1 Tax=Paenibacillus sp. SAFN-117 TaxID=3436860 RepID=UPI000A27E505|nr:Uncharacterised protein [Chlamydia abortus]
MNNHRVLLNAVPFGYGPVSKIASVARKLVQQKIECVFVGCGVAYEYFKREQISEAIELNFYNSDGAERLSELCQNFSYGLTSMDFDFVNICSDKIQIGYVDSLFWMWDTTVFDQNPRLREVSHYFIQNTFAAQEKVDQFQIYNPVLIGSVIDVPITTLIRKNRAVIHLGGVENIYVPIREIQYPFVVIKVLNDLRDLWQKYDEVIVVCSETIADELRIAFPDFPGEFTSLSHKSFISLLAESDLLLTAPGLTTILEAFQLRIRTVFLPPQNYSQYLILRGLTSENYPGQLPNWDYFERSFHIPDNTPEDLAVKIVKERIDQFSNSGSEQLKLRNLLHSRLNDIGKTQSELDFQDSFIERVGTDGLDSIINAICGMGIQNKSKSLV